MLIVLALLALASLPLCAEDFPLDGSPGPVTVILEFEQQFSPVSLAEMKREVDSIMRPSSLQLDWRLLDDSVSKQSFSQLVVARFKGSCRPGHDAAGPAARSALAITHLSDGEILPFSEVDCTKVRTIIGGELMRRSDLRGEQLLGRALGRVLAHELYHILAGTRQHARSGVAKEVLGSRELVDGKLEFGPQETENIRRNFHRGPVTTTIAGGM